jgi:hypothetical protein
MRYLIFFVISALAAAAAPFATSDRAPQIDGAQFPGWPTHFEGRGLKPLDLSEREKRFADKFPGQIAKFSDGSRTIIVRWVTRETRKLHPASDCFKGAGYTVTNLPARSDSQDSLWGCFHASKGREGLHVSERVFDNHGNGWPDISSWYWSAFLGRSAGPWWALTVIERTLASSSKYQSETSRGQTTD